MKKNSVFLLIAMLCIGFTSCQKDNNLGQTAPTIPPQESFIIDFQDLSTGKTEATQLNAFFAGINVLTWNTVLVSTLAIPVTAFKASFNQEATFADGTWTWAYNFDGAGGINHSARLEAEVIGTASINWSMYISKDGSYEDFLWFTGTSNVDSRSGTWTLMLEPESPKEFLNITYDLDNSNEGTIKYLNVLENNPNNGSYIEYGHTGTEAFDVFYDIFKSEDSDLINIEFNKNTKAGRVKSLQHFGDESWHCWNGANEDVDC